VTYDLNGVLAAIRHRILILRETGIGRDSCWLLVEVWQAFQHSRLDAVVYRDAASGYI
jgi:hypothetical protein